MQKFRPAGQELSELPQLPDNPVYSSMAKHPSFYRKWPTPELNRSATVQATTFHEEKTTTQHNNNNGDLNEILPMRFPEIIIQFRLHFLNLNLKLIKA